MFLAQDGPAKAGTSHKKGQTVPDGIVMALSTVNPIFSLAKQQHYEYYS